MNRVCKREACRERLVEMSSTFGRCGGQRAACRLASLSLFLYWPSLIRKMVWLPQADLDFDVRLPVIKRLANVQTELLGKVIISSPRGLASVLIPGLITYELLTLPDYILRDR